MALYVVTVSQSTGGWTSSCSRAKPYIYRYMSAHVLVILLNELGKRDKMRGLSSILSLFRNEFDKFKNTGARMLDSIYHMTLKLFLFHIFDVKTLGFCHMRNIKSVIS